MMPDIINQVGPKEFGHLAELMKEMQGGAGEAAAEDEDDAPPELVGTFEDAAKK
jgi:hypothetical protein